MNEFDFKNNRAINLADPKYDKDAINLRSARNLFANLTGTTVNYLPLSGGTGGPYTFTGNTLISSAFVNLLSGGTIYSGSTDLYNIFQPIGTDLDQTHVQPGTNINTGGTTNDPVVNLNDNILLNTITATTISATTMSASTVVVNPVGQYKIGSDNALKFPANNTNIAIGAGAGSLLTSGVQNVFIGSDCGGNTNSNYNTYIGNKAGQSIVSSTATNNVAIGQQTGEYLDTASSLILIGKEAGRSLTTGDHNVFIGYQCGYYFRTGGYNTLIGYQSGAGNATGCSGILNVGIGRYSLYKITSGDTNTAIGSGAGYSATTCSGNVFVGYNSGYYETNNNTLYVSNSNTTNPLIYGDFGTGYIRINNVLSAQTISATTVNYSSTLKNSTDNTLNNIKTKKFTIGIAGETGMDHNFTSVNNNNDQGIQLGNTIPANSPIINLGIRCTNNLIGGGGDTMNWSAATYSQTDNLGTSSITADTSYQLYMTTSASTSSVYIFARPNNNWNTLTSGKWSVYMTYLDNDF